MNFFVVNSNLKNANNNYASIQTPVNKLKQLIFGNLDRKQYTVLHNDAEIIYNQLIPVINHLLKNESAQDFEHSVFTFNYRIKKQDETLSTIYQKCKFLVCPKTGNPISIYGTLTPIHYLKNDFHIILQVLNNQPNNHSGEGKLQTTYYFQDSNVFKLSTREKEIIRCVAEGLSIKLIAQKLCITESTVSNHRSNILKKTNCTNVASLIAFSARNGII